MRRRGDVARLQDPNPPEASTLQPTTQSWRRAVIRGGPEEVEAANPLRRRRRVCCGSVNRLRERYSGHRRTGDARPASDCRPLTGRGKSPHARTVQSATRQRGLSIVRLVGGRFAAIVTITSSPRCEQLWLRLQSARECRTVDMVVAGKAIHHTCEDSANGNRFKDDRTSD